MEVIKGCVETRRLSACSAPYEVKKQTLALGIGLLVQRVQPWCRLQVGNPRKGHKSCETLAYAPKHRSFTRCPLHPSPPPPYPEIS